jgi:hypothetical protein
MTNFPDFFPQSDELDELLAAPATEARPLPLIAPPLFTETCAACRGSGRFISWSGRTVGACFKCKGSGKRRFKKSAEDRSKAREAAAERKIRTAADNLAAFAEAHPDIAAWWTDSTFEFAVSLREAARKFGHLTDNQLSAARRCIEKLAAAQASAQDRRDNAPTIDLGKVGLALSTAVTNGLRHPKLRLDKFTFSLAPATGKNAGAVYVKTGEQYLGKLAEGRFFGTRECDSETESKLLSTVADPFAAAVAHGKLTGNCSCCGRDLTNEASVALGIGPICRGKFGW